MNVLGDTVCENLRKSLILLMQAKQALFVFRAIFSRFSTSLESFVLFIS
mgnify:CR=1 FL=1